MSAHPDAIKAIALLDWNVVEGFPGVLEGNYLTAYFLWIPYQRELGATLSVFSYNYLLFDISWTYVCVFFLPYFLTFRWRPHILFSLPF